MGRWPSELYGRPVLQATATLQCSPGHQRVRCPGEYSDTHHANDYSDDSMTVLAMGLPGRMKSSVGCREANEQLRFLHGSAKPLVI
jgi:hypothetical protein